MFSELLWIYTSVTESNVYLPRGSNAMPSQYVAELNIQIWNSPVELRTAGIIVLNRPQGLPLPNSWRYMEMVIDSVIKPYWDHITEGMAHEAMGNFFQPLWS